MTKFFKIICILLFFLDVSYTFLQFYNTPIDGDLAPGVVPAPDVQEILDNPLGIKAFIENKEYSNPNRFFSHWLCATYFNKAPLFFQKFLSPINSLYFSAALVKIFSQLLFIFSLSLLAIKLFNPIKNHFWLATILISPLFQTNGFNGFLGIIDHSVTYTFFYALPIAFLVVYLGSFFLILSGKFSLNYSNWLYLLTIPASLILSLSSPLIPGVALVMVVVILWFKIKFKTFNLRNNWTLLFLFPLTIFSIYSLLLGKFNAISNENSLPMIELYSRLPLGVFNLLTQKAGYSVLLIGLLINLLIINRIMDLKTNKFLILTVKACLVFILLYILLLPLGGYREYRPNLLRYDTMIPATLILIFLFTTTTLVLLNRLGLKHLYLLIPIFYISYYSIADEPEFYTNDCEKNALEIISQSDLEVVKLPESCKVLSWDIIQNPENSDLNAQLLLRLKIIDKKKLYFFDSSIKK